MAPSAWESASVFLFGVVRRWYMWAGAILLNPFDFYNRLIMPHLPIAWQKEYEMPSAVGILVLIGLLMWAGVCTYHELNQRKHRETSDRDATIASRDSTIQDLTTSKPDPKVAKARQILKGLADDLNKWVHDAVEPKDMKYVDRDVTTIRQLLEKMLINRSGFLSEGSGAIAAVKRHKQVANEMRQRIDWLNKTADELRLHHLYPDWQA